MKKLNTEEEEAKRLKMAPKTLANQRCRGDGPPFLKVGRLVRYDPELTDAWLAERVHRSTSEAASGGISSDQAKQFSERKNESSEAA